MRSVTVIMRPANGAFHPLDEQLNADDRITREIGRAHV